MAIPTLPNDIIDEIFLRLPAKSLIRFSCLSKSYFYLISSSDFRNKHRKFSKNSIDNKRILLRNNDGKLKHCSLPSFLQKPTVDAFDADFGSSKFICLGSCDGLICLAVEYRTLILWNPSIRKSKRLPVSDTKLNKTSFQYCGFGYDKSSDDYKVVIFNDSTYFKATLLKIYSLKTNQWKSIKNLGSHITGVLVDDRVTCANGKFCWISYSELVDQTGSTHPETGETICTREWNIGYLDMETEKYGLFEKPNYVACGLLSALFASEGSLYALCGQYTGGELWLVGRESWTKVATIANSEAKLMYLRRDIVYVIENGEILLNCGSKWKFMIFNPKDGSFRCPDMRNSINVRATFTYVESLVSPLM